jgi:hypothetical protein
MTGAMRTPRAGLQAEGEERKVVMLLKQNRVPDSF